MVLPTDFANTPVPDSAAPMEPQPPDAIVVIFRLLPQALIIYFNSNQSRAARSERQRT